MSDLVKRLLKVNRVQAPYANDVVCEWCHEAADALTRLQVENERLREALEGAMEKIRLYREEYGYEYLGGITMMELDRIARAALSPAP